MADAERVRLEIAFEGASVLSVYVSAAVAEGLDRALAEEPVESLSFDAEDGHYTVAVGKIVFVKRFRRESRVGFGATS